MEIKQVTREEASKIIETSEPRGLFYEIDRDVYVGIDNLDGHAWVEEFKTKGACFDWLNGIEAIEEEEKYLTELERKQIQVIDYYGTDEQLNRLVEESSELIQAIMKMKRVSKTFFCSHSLVQEIADVKNLIKQLELKYEYLRDAIKIMVEQKVERQLERIKGEG